MQQYENFYDTVRSDSFPAGNYFRKYNNGRIPFFKAFERCNFTIQEFEQFIFGLEGSPFSKVWQSDQYGLKKPAQEGVIPETAFAYEAYEILVTLYANRKEFGGFMSMPEIEAIEGGPTKECTEWYVKVYYKPTCSHIAKLESYFLDKTAVKVKTQNEISLISKDSDGGLTTKVFTLNVKEVDLALNYGDKFPAIYNKILERLNTDNDKGIVLFHSVPGCGKTSLIRHIVSQIKSKEVIFVPPYLVEVISSPDFLPFLTDHPNSIFVIEDAERVLLSRDSGQGSSQGVSTILNMGDGLLSDCLNIQFICTFNTAAENIDKALTRKGRLIADYKFEPLSVEDSNRLLKHLGKQTVAKAPMTLADIYGADEEQIKAEEKGTATIGFKRY